VKYSMEQKIRRNSNTSIIRINIDNLDTEEREKARSVESTEKKPPALQISVFRADPWSKGMLISQNTECRIATSEDGDRNKYLDKSIKPSSGLNLSISLFGNKNEAKFS
jgi:hypothetical protein